jgi:ABC-type lipoprotein export system ATPase subunit
MEMVHFQRKTMGIMYQQFNLIPSITVLDNVALPLIFAGLTPTNVRKKHGSFLSVLVLITLHINAHRFFLEDNNNVFLLRGLW